LKTKKTNLLSNQFKERFFILANLINFELNNNRENETVKEENVKQEEDSKPEDIKVEELVDCVQSLDLAVPMSRTCLCTDVEMMLHENLIEK